MNDKHPTHRDQQWWMRWIAHQAEARCSDEWMVTDADLWRACRHTIKREALCEAGRFTEHRLDSFDPQVRAILNWAGEILDQDTVAAFAAMLDYAYSRGRCDLAH